MNPHLGMTREWADGEYRFLMRPPELNAFQAFSKVPLLMLYQHVRVGNIEFDTLIEGVVLLLIGGGATPKDARRLVKDYIVAPQRFEEAYEILNDGFVRSMKGYWGEDLPKQDPPKDSSDNPSNGQVDMSPSESSTSE